MEKLVDDAGKCRSIGVMQQLPNAVDACMIWLLKARIQPACNQVEVHPYYSMSVSQSLVNCASRGYHHDGALATWWPVPLAQGRLEG